MSGIYIPGLEMPNACDECACGILLDGYLMPFCAITSKDMCRNDFHTKRQDDCPLVPVPPHGRLIDADALSTAVLDSKYWDNADEDVAWELVQDAPTIIPASEEGAKAEKDTEPWLCLSCRHYPPSSTDGKPCSQCNPSEVWHSCYDQVDEGET